MPEDKTLVELKKEYTKIKKKYNLPEFKKLNTEFEIGKLSEKESDFLLRNIRRAIERRTEGFLKMLEEFINPTYASVASLTLLKSFGTREKRLVQDAYQDLVSIMLQSVVLEIENDEKKEAKFIKDSMMIWDKTKKQLHELMSSAESIWKKKIEEDKSTFKYSG